MSIWAIAAIIVFFASVILSQRIAVQAGTRLDAETKLKIAEVFPKRNANFTVVVLAIVVVFLIAIYAYPQYSFVMSIVYAIAFVAYLFTKLFLNVRKLKEMNAPGNYVRQIVVSFAVFIGGAIAAILVFAGGRSLLH